MDRVAVSRAAREICEGLIELAWPTRCIGCDGPGGLLCAACEERLPLIDQQTCCPACGAPYGVHVCTECWTRDGPVEHRFAQAACAMEFEGLAARMVVCYKDQGERRLSGLLAELIAAAAASRWSGPPAAVTYVPSTPEALRRRGFDHMQPVAARVAELLGAPCERLLDKLDTADQRLLGRRERIENMRASFRLASADPPRPGYVLLVDDVLTTGATLDAAAGTLLDAGWEEVRAATACRVW